MSISKTYIISIFIVAKLFATAFSLYVVDQFTPLVDAKLYQSEDFFNHKITLRTYLIQVIASVSNFLTSPIISHYLFSITSILGILWYIKYNKVTWHVLFILLLPTSMIWTSIISKEAIFYLFFSLMLICWNFYLNNSWKKSYWYILILACLVCLVLRPHYTFPIFWLFWVVFIIKNFKNFKPVLFFTLFSVFTICLLIIFFGGHIDKYLSINFFDLKLKAFLVIDFDARASRHFELGFGNFQKVVNIDAGKVVFVSDEVHQILSQKLNSVFIIGFFYGIIGPFIEETMKRPEFLPFLIEGIVILSIPLMFFIYLKYKQIDNKNIFYLNYIYGVLPAIILVMTIHSFFGIFNPGTAIRWRINFELIFYFAPYLIYLNLKELKNERNPTFSS